MSKHPTKLFPAGVFATLVLMVVGFAAPASAQTADGMTPSEETICDSEVGKAFGFCNAYCEAMDCDSEFANASDEACLKVEDKFLVPRRSKWNRRSF